MARRVQLVLNQDVSKLGRAGDVVEVAPGYARNYLIPQGFGAKATSNLLKQVERRRELERQRLAELKAGAEVQKTAIEKIGRVTIAKQAGENDAIFGTVTERELADAILQLTKQEVDRREISLPEIKKLGTYQAEIRLHPDVIAKLEVEVVTS